MSRLLITGGTPLLGTVRISGRKNAALKMLAGTLLTTGTTTLNNVPRIGDVAVLLEILSALGAVITEDPQDPTTLTVATAAVNTSVIPHDLGRKLRASLVLVGPLLARFGKASFPHPGGCVIGKRSIDPHLDGFRSLGATVSFDGTYYQLAAPTLTGQEVYLRERSVTATENVLMAACGASGTTTIVNAAEEEHISNLCALLRGMGYSISGDGSSVITIYGAPLSATSSTCAVIADEIEVGTFAVAAALTGGTVTMTHTGSRRSLLPLLAKLDDFGVSYTFNDQAEELTVAPPHALRAANVQTNPWPGFFPDLQSPFTVLATQAPGTSLIHDWMYEGRLYFVDSLQRMGANIVVCDPHRALVTGPTPLIRAKSVSPDLRAGAALVLAALAAEGESEIEKAELIDRGYAELDTRLRLLGAHITRRD
jgi:UDP-N-acetylglucosamine 1-carboxyvinyltransferase